MLWITILCAACGECMKKFRLYGTSACHLCELAQRMIASEKPTIFFAPVSETSSAMVNEAVSKYGLLNIQRSKSDGFRMGIAPRPRADSFHKSLLGVCLFEQHSL